MKARSHILSRSVARAITVMSAVVFVGSAPMAQAGVNVWTSHGPEGGDVPALAIDPVTPSTLYAATSDGVFKSTDAGSTWSAASAGLLGTDLRVGAVVALAIDPVMPSTLYAGTTNGVFKSTDAGASWNAVNNGLPSNAEASALAIDPDTPSTLYAGTVNTGVFKSTDAGATWVATGGVTHAYVNSLVIDPSTPSTLYASTYGGRPGTYFGVFKSTDAGSTWSLASTGLQGGGLIALAIDPATPRTLYAARQEGAGPIGVFKSTDAAATWSATGLTITSVNAVAIDPRAPTTLYAATEASVFKSTDAGATWAATGPTNTYVHKVTIDPIMPSTVYAGTTSGAFKSTDAGATWNAAYAGLPAAAVGLLTIDPTTPGTLYAQTGGGVLYKSTDTGVAWVRHQPAGDTGSLVIDPLMSSTLYAETGDGILKSTDGAATWSVANAGLPNTSVNVLAIDPVTPSRLYAGTETCCQGGGDVYKSVDAGGRWNAIGGFDYPVLALAIDPTAPSTLYAAGGRYGGEFVGFIGGIAKSTDGGVTWDRASIGLEDTCSSVEALAIDPVIPTTLYAVTRCGLYKSTNAGNTWTATGSSDYFLELVGDPVTAGVLYAATYSGGVLKSTDAGTTWNTLNTGFPATPLVFTLVIDPLAPDTLYAGTDSGVYSIQQVPVSCVGDCDAHGQVAIDELTTLVAIALGNPGSCPSGVPAGTTVDIALIIRAVNHALSGCPSSDLYVSASGALDGDGSVANPYRRITDAVGRARAQRQTGAISPEEEIRIHVAPGTYIGSFSPTQLQVHPEYEVLPIILNVPRLAVLGGTVLMRDERALPTAADSGSETIVKPDTHLEPNQYLFLVTRTAEGGVGNDVTLDGLALDGANGAYPGATVFIDRVTGFTISNNLIQHASFGLLARLASGTIEGNLFADNHELGMHVTGGSLAHPATLLIQANRATRNGAHGFGFTTSGYVNGGYVSLRTDPGRNTVTLLEPLQTIFDRTNPDDLQNIPDTLTVTLSDNDASDNLRGIGIRFAQIFPDFDYRTLDNSQPLTSRLTAHVVGNTSTGNGSYGVAIEGGSTDRAEARQFIQTVAVAFEANSFADNGRVPALFTFTYWRVSAGLNPSSYHKFAEASIYAVTDADGELEEFDYDHPVMDPVSGTVLNNTFTLNGVEVPHGTRITPASQLR